MFLIYIFTEVGFSKCLQQKSNWQKCIPNLDLVHDKCDPHGIYKHHNIGHTEMAWNIRTNKKVKKVFEEIYNTNELIVSFDGACYIDKKCKKKDKIWTHTDQGPREKKRICIQGFVALTDNKERSLVVYEKSHMLHAKYMEDFNITKPDNWVLIDHDYLKTIHENKRILNVKAGSLVLWDSRCFHQNQYGSPNSEERIVQYVCYLPKNHEKNTENNKKKRMKYFLENRTTSHWPCPVKVNSKQPRTFGDDRLIIDYDEIPNVRWDENMLVKIKELII